MKKLILLVFSAFLFHSASAQKFEHLGTANVAPLRYGAVPIGMREGNYVFLSTRYKSFVSIDKDFKSYEKIPRKIMRLTVHNDAYYHRSVKVDGENFTVFQFPKPQFDEKAPFHYYIFKGSLYGQRIISYKFDGKTTVAANFSDNGKYVAVVENTQPNVIQLFTVQDSSIRVIKLEREYDKLKDRIFVSNSGEVYKVTFEELEYIIERYTAKAVYLYSRGLEAGYSSSNISLKFLNDDKIALGYILDVKQGEKESGYGCGYGVGVILFDAKNDELTVVKDDFIYYSDETITRFNGSIVSYAYINEKKYIAKRTMLKHYHIYDIKYANDQLYVLCGSEYVHVMTPMTNQSPSSSTNFFHYDPMLITAFSDDVAKTELLERSFASSWRLSPPMMITKGEYIDILYNNRSKTGNYVCSFKFNKYLEILDKKLQKILAKWSKGELIDFSELIREDENNYIVYSWWGKKLSFFRMTLE